MEKTNHWLTLVANLGVIAGLIFLGIEIRQNTNIARASAYRENIQDIAAWRELTIANPDVSRLFGVYLDGGIETLDDVERGRISGLINNVMGIYENAYFARGYGIIGDEEWVRFQTGACMQFTVATKNGLTLRYMTTGYRQYLEDTCETGLSN